MTGINVLGGSTAILKFNKSNLIDLSNNAKSSGYHAGMDGSVNTKITFDSINKVTLNNNGWDAINFQTGDYSRLNIINSKNVELKGNSGWGTNGGDLYFSSSNIDASDNATFTKVLRLLIHLYIDFLVLLNVLNTLLDIKYNKLDKSDLFYMLLYIGIITLIFFILFFILNNIYKIKIIVF